MDTIGPVREADEHKAQTLAELADALERHEAV
jgi:hypothetical protein